MKLPSFVWSEGLFLLEHCVFAYNTKKNCSLHHAGAYILHALLVQKFKEKPGDVQHQGKRSSYMSLWFALYGVGLPGRDS